MIIYFLKAVVSLIILTVMAYVVFIGVTYVSESPEFCEIGPVARTVLNLVFILTCAAWTIALNYFLWTCKIKIEKK